MLEFCIFLGNTGKVLLLPNLKLLWYLVLIMLPSQYCHEIVCMGRKPLTTREVDGKLALLLYSKVHLAKVQDWGFGVMVPVHVNAFVCHSPLARTLLRQSVALTTPIKVLLDSLTRGLISAGLKL